MLDFIIRLFRRKNKKEKHSKDVLPISLGKENTAKVEKECTVMANKNTAVALSQLTEHSKVGSQPFSIKKVYGSTGYDKIVPWLVKYLLPAGSNGVWFGQSQSFKTFVLIDIACRIATGRKFSDLPTKQGLVFIIAAEGENGLSKRIRGWELQNNCIVGEHLIVIPHAVFPADVNQKTNLIDEIESERKRQGLPVALIIFDTMSQCSNGMSENEAGEVSRYLQSCKSIGELFGATVINVHHTKKGSEDFRGSSTIVSNVDFLISMKRDGKQSKSTKLNLVKMKEGSTNFRWDIKLDCYEIDAVDEDKETINTLCLTHVELAKLDESSDNSEVKQPQYKADAEWLHAYLTKSIDASAPLSCIKQAMALEFNIPQDDKLTVRLDRAKRYLKQANLISAAKQGREVFVSLLKAA